MAAVWDSEVVPLLMADIRVATNTVQHAPATPSVVELPVLGR